MRINRTVGIVFALINCIALVVCVVLFLRTDRIKPEFKAVTTQTIYTRDMEQEELLDGIMAYDNRDGDITADIVIEKITENEKEKTAVVVYAVRDKSGNVAKFPRLFPALYAQDVWENSGAGPETGDGEDTPETAPVMDDSTEVMTALSQEGNGRISVETTQEEEDLGEEAKEEENSGEEAKEEENSGEEATEEEASGEESSEEEVPEEEASEENTPEEGTEESEADGEESDSQQENTDGNTTAERNAAGAPPTLILKADEIKTQAGSKPPWVSVIQTMTDDKDSYETLFYNLQASEFDRNTPGSYPITVYTVDSDGNESARSSITVVVQ